MWVSGAIDTLKLHNTTTYQACHVPKTDNQLNLQRLAANAVTKEEE